MAAADVKVKLPNEFVIFPTFMLPLVEVVKAPTQPLPPIVALVIVRSPDLAVKLMPPLLVAAEETLRPPAISTKLMEPVPITDALKVTALISNARTAPTEATEVIFKFVLVRSAAASEPDSSTEPAELMVIVPPLA